MSPYLLTHIILQMINSDLGAVPWYLRLHPEFKGTWLWVLSDHPEFYDKEENRIRLGIQRLLQSSLILIWPRGL